MNQTVLFIYLWSKSFSRLGSGDGLAIHRSIWDWKDE